MKSSTMSRYHVRSETTSHQAVQKHGLRPNRFAPVRPHEGRYQLTLSPSIVGLMRNSLFEAIKLTG